MLSPVQILHQISAVALLSMAIAIIPAALGVAYAVRPSEARLALMRPLSLASLFAALAGFASGLINGLMWVSRSGDSLASGAALAGLSESLVPLFVSFTALTVAWLLVALGLRRQAVPGV